MPRRPLRGASLDVQNDAVEFRVRAERRIGQLLAETPKAKGSARPGVGRRGQCGADEGPHSDAPTLADLSITKKQSAKWQRIAARAEVPTFPSRRRPPACAETGGGDLPKPGTLARGLRASCGAFYAFYVGERTFSASCGKKARLN